jgi:hypothetical protein
MTNTQLEVRIPLLVTGSRCCKANNQSLNRESASQNTTRLVSPIGKHDPGVFAGQSEPDANIVNDRTGNQPQRVSPLAVMVLQQSVTRDHHSYCKCSMTRIS